MYYGLIILSVVMLSSCFALNDVHRKIQGSSIKVSIRYSAISSLGGLVALIVLNGFKPEFTFFTFIMALLTAINGFAFTFCTFRALGNINLSLYSLFSMLGGMALPSVLGLVFYNEKLTLAKAVCYTFIIASLLLTVQKGEKKKGTLFYIGIFTLNGMSGVLNKIFTAAPFKKTSAAGYLILAAISTFVIAIILLLVFFRKIEAPKPTPLSITISSVNGIVNKLANFVLVLALAHVDASVQYPMVTGGVMIMSTIICFFGKNKPSKKEILSVFIAFTGLLLLFLIPV